MGERQEATVRSAGAGRAARPRLPRRALHGVLLLDKPLGWTSNDALQKAKHLLRAEKGGHTGTLDPLATGLLPLCFGAATKFSQASLDADKRYTATLRLGQRTTTGDREGEVVEDRTVQVDRALIDAALAALCGPIEQIPPMYSALKHQGRALYDWARAGIEIERAPRAVTIHRLDMLSWHDAELVIDVLCSKGTYVRTLAEAIGERLGCGAHLSALRRTASGPLAVADAVTLEQMAALGDNGGTSDNGENHGNGSQRSRAALDALLRPPECLLADWPTVELGAEDAGRFLCGLRRRVQAADAPAVQVFARHPRAFLGTARIVAGELIAERLLSPAEVRPAAAS